MPVNSEIYKEISVELKKKNVTLIAVSKTKTPEDILKLYHLGQRDFGENYVQELVEKYARLPKDIRWHFIGHLQSNKVKLIAPFVSLIQSVDSRKLLNEINKEAKKNNREIDCLLEVHIAKEETKFGFDEHELGKLFTDLPCLQTGYTEDTYYKNICIKGLMGMASYTDNENVVRNEFQSLKSLFDKYATFSILSMGMSTDYKLAIEEGSNMVRIGSLLFGERSKK